jgi:iron complex outermembrane receptor protein
MQSDDPKSIIRRRFRWQGIIVGTFTAAFAGPTTLALATEGPADGQSAKVSANNVMGEPSASDTGVEEIIVTAQRRGERLEDVPISVNVQTAATLEQAGVTNARDLTLVVPGLNFTAQGDNAQPTLRGLSTETATAGSESNVAIYLDDVYQPAEAGNAIDLPDVQQIEVLKGPQGTLFGRNATAGAILIHTLEPSFTSQGKVSVSAGAFDTRGQEYRTKAFVTGPIMDKLAYSVSAMYTNNTGYFRDVLRNHDGGQIRSQVFRAKLLWEPASWIKIEPTGFYTNSKDYSAYSYYQTHPVAAAIGGVLPTKPWEIASDTRGSAVTSNYGGSLKAEFQLDAGTLKSVSSFSKVDALNITDADATPVPVQVYFVDTPTKSVSEEITFASRRYGPLSFITGVYYFNDSMKLDPLGIGRSLYTLHYLGVDQTSDSQAWFAQGSYQIIDRLTADIGIRYSHEVRDYKGSTTNINPLPEIAKASFSKWTPRYSLRYKVAQDSNVYFTYSEGFKSGQFSSTSFSPVPIKPEETKAYELGFKTALSQFDFNAAVFRTDVTNRQVQTQLASSLSILTNAASARVEGVEFDAGWKATQNFNTRLVMSWLPTAKYESYPNAAIVAPNPNPAVGGGINQTLDLSGKRLQKVPELQMSLLLNYTKNLSFGRVDASTNIAYLSRYHYDVGGYLIQAGYPLINMNVSWSPNSSNFRLGAFVKNLTNRANIESYQSPLAINYMPPREAGLSADYSF